MRFFNNLSKKAEEFTPINPPIVSIYSCGPTVYDISHIGHARSSIVWDLLYRYLNFKGFNVKWARNITNVDDKIINRAKELGVSPDQLSRKYTYEFWDDMSKLNLSWPTYEPRATDYIREMISVVSSLIEKGFAYEVNGDVYFRVNKHAQYGQLKGQSIDELRKGLGRVDPNPNKEDQLDFALWKSFPDDDGSFDSPWGKGRPGWHLECSTMIHSLFGEIVGDTIDIHTGGDDLICPHHENECAQSESLTGKPLAKFWLHNGMIMINGKKMSKSENNYLTIKDVLNSFSANAIRYFVLSTHYKKQINYTHEALEAAETGFEKLSSAIENADLSKEKDLDQSLIEEFTKLMDDDLNSPQAIALLFENKDKAKTVKTLAEVLGFDFSKQKANSKESNSEGLDVALNLLSEIRDKARANKDFETSDKIRDELAKANIQLSDGKLQTS